MSLLAHLRWPVPAVLVWVLAWATGWGLRWAGATLLIALLAATLVGVVGSVWGTTRMRRLIIAGGFPLSWAVMSGALTVAPWVWLVWLSLLLLIYPPSTWNDAPVFPTPVDAFDGLREVLPLPLAAHVLDAGSGLGHGLVALDRAYPDVYLYGLERSWPLVWVSRWRCRGAKVEQGDFWAEDWGRYDLVYLFQRPETMPRAMTKAAQELKPGTWLASLEFSDPIWIPTQIWNCPDGRPLYLYQSPLHLSEPDRSDVLGAASRGGPSH